MKRFKKGGIHPASNKITAGLPIRGVVECGLYYVMLSQNIGAPASAIVKPGQHVEKGERIADPTGFISVPVHSPVEGVVKKIEPVRDPQGIWRQCVIIEADAVNRNFTIPSDSAFDLEKAGKIYQEYTPRQIVDGVHEAGIVGAGGAAFPTHVKLSVPKGKKAEFVLLNGAECEPYLTCDDSLMNHSPRKIIEGMRLIMKAVDAPKGIVGIESNKPRAIAAMKEAAEDYPEISVETLRTAYPQGSEKQLIYALTGREVPNGGLPIDVGAIVDNVTTAWCVADAVIDGNCMCSRLVTVTGKELSNPGDFLVPVGTPISVLMEAAGGIPSDTGKVIAGGPMMGKAVSNLDAPAVKGMSGILVLPEAQSRRPSVYPCIKCGKCMEACPMGLEPYLLMTFGERNMDEDALAHGVMNCLECGSCSYICPSARPILDYIRLSRQRIRANKK